MSFLETLLSLVSSRRRIVSYKADRIPENRWRFVLVDGRLGGKRLQKLGNSKTPERY
jgi:hypothetical protein